MSRSIYLMVFVCIAAAVSFAQTWAARVAGERRLWWLTLAAVCILLIVGFLDWLRVSGNETSLLTYTIVAVLPTVLTAVLARWAAMRAAPFSVQFLIGAVIWLAVAGACLFLGFFP